MERTDDRLHDGTIHALDDAVVLRRVRHSGCGDSARLSEECLELVGDELAAAVGVELRHRLPDLHCG